MWRPLPRKYCCATPVTAGDLHVLVSRTTVEEPDDCRTAGAIELALTFRRCLPVNALDPDVIDWDVVTCSRRDGVLRM